MWWIKEYLKAHRRGIFMYFLFCVIIAVVFNLYQIPMEAVGYAVGLCSVASILFGLLDGIKYAKRITQLKLQKEAVINGIEEFPNPDNEMERLYQELLKILQEERSTQIDKLLQEKTDITDYFTLWAHQIKTPIAAMGMILQQEQGKREEIYDQRKEAQGELFKIEQYVEMVLQYLRLKSSVNDFVLEEYELDEMICQAVRKYASMFIRKKLTLHYEPINVKIVTDEKWIVFVIEQILSNAVKYTRTGSVSIYMEESMLIVADTGMGILPEDLPRIFDKGYTGYNGRSDKKATGIGLYLCKQVLYKLGHKIQIESELGRGTKVKLLF